VSDAGNWRLATIDSFSMAKQAHRIDVHAVGTERGAHKWFKPLRERCGLEAVLMWYDLNGTG